MHLWQTRSGNTPNFSSCHRYARGLKTAVGILPPLRGSDVNSMSTVGCVHAFGVHFTHGWNPVAPMGLKSGELAVEDGDDEGLVASEDLSRVRIPEVAVRHHAA